MDSKFQLLNHSKKKKVLLYIYIYIYIVIGKNCLPNDIGLEWSLICVFMYFKRRLE